MRKRILAGLGLAFILMAIVQPNIALAFDKGIYITSSTAQYTKTMKYLIRRSKAVGINTFVIDYYNKSRKYRHNIQLVKKNKIRYIARIVVFPYGAKHSQVTSKAYREKIWKRIKGAVEMGAQEIQLDYIRYSKRQPASEKNAQNIYEVIKDYRQRLKKYGVRMQIDIFGVAASRPSKSIGQNVPLFANSVDAICPMVYPSHYEPYRYHAVRPYKTVLESVVGLKRQLRHHPHVRVFAYIELYNYRYPMSRATKVKYIQSQIQAAKDAGADGWYAWSAQNKYNILFNVLQHSK